MKVLRLGNPEPARRIGLAWRRTSPRKGDFTALGKMITETLGLPALTRRSAA